MAGPMVVAMRPMGTRRSRPAFAITHAPGHMPVTDVADTEFQVA
jgi:uncharacterized protein YcsI (UPF0317 family)